MRIFNRKNKQQSGIPEELKGSFAVTPYTKHFDKVEFKKWYSEIVHVYHPINNQMFND